MTRLFSGILLGFFAAMLLPLEASPGTSHKRCGYPWRESTEAKVRVIDCWSAERGLDAERVLEIGYCESGDDLQDRYAADGHGGTFQHITEAWEERADAYEADGSPIWDVWAQAKVSTGMMGDGGWSHWSCA